MLNSGHIVMLIEVKLPTIILPCRCWDPSNGTPLCKFSGCRQPPMGKTVHGRGCFFLRRCMKLVGIFCNSDVAASKLSTNCVTSCYRVLTSIETGSSFNRKLISWCRTLGWQFSLSKDCVNHFWYFSRIDDLFFHTQERHDWKEALNESIHINLCLN